MTTMLLDDGELKRVVRDLVIANSPSFLYRRLVANPSVNALALRPTEELLARIREVHSSLDPTFVDMADAYAGAAAAGRARKFDDLEQVASQPGHLKFLAGLINHAKSSSSPSLQVKEVGPNDYVIDLSAGTGSWRKPTFTFEQASTAGEPTNQWAAYKGSVRACTLD